MPLDTAQLREGTVVSYEDMANPRRVGVVEEQEVTEWGTQYIVVFDNGTHTTSDMRQYGWNIEVSKDAPATLER